VEDRLELLDVAGRAVDWIGSVAVDVDGGMGWLEDGVLFDDLYSGTAGVLLGCAEAAAAGHGTGLGRCSRPVAAPRRTRPGRSHHAR
jgi:hypothetical protein